MKNESRNYDNFDSYLAWHYNVGEIVCTLTFISTEVHPLFAGVGVELLVILDFSVLLVLEVDKAVLPHAPPILSNIPLYLETDALCEN